MLGDVLGGFIVIIVGANLVGPVADQITAAQAGNVSGAASNILGLTTLFFATSIMSTGVAMTAAGLRNAGVM